MAQPTEPCVCPAFIGLTLSLASHWPLLKSWTLNPLSLIWSYFQLHQYERALICSLSKLGLRSVLVWPLFKNLSNICVCFQVVLYVKEMWGRLRNRMRKKPKDKTKNICVYLKKEEIFFLFAFSTSIGFNKPITKFIIQINQILKKTVIRFLLLRSKVWLKDCLALSCLLTHLLPHTLFVFTSTRAYKSAFNCISVLFGWLCRDQSQSGSWTSRPCVLTGFAMLQEQVAWCGGYFVIIFVFKSRLVPLRAKISFSIEP